MAVRKIDRLTKGIELLIDKMGAEIAVHLDDYRTQDHHALKSSRVRVELGYIEAEDERGEGETVLPDWPIYKGEHKPAAVAVLWDRPTIRHERHRAFLRRVLETAGVHDDEVGHVWAFPYVTEGAPLPADIAAYRALTMDA